MEELLQKLQWPFCWVGLRVLHRLHLFDFFMQLKLPVCNAQGRKLKFFINVLNHYAKEVYSYLAKNISKFTLFEFRLMKSAYV